MQRPRPIWWLAVVLAVSLAGMLSVGSGESPVVDSPASSVDARGDVTLDAVRRSGSTAEVIGWRLGGGPVEIRVDGELVSTVTASVPRMDVAVAYGFRDPAVGFTTTIDLPADAFSVCVATPGAIPATGACDRVVVDLDVHRMVAFYGVPGVPVLGTLGNGTVNQVRARLQAQAAPYDLPDRPVVHAFEIIATVAQWAPGPDGDYSHPTPTEDIWEYLEAIREIGGHVILDFQPGQGDYLEQMRAVEEVLIQPDVHLALDPEWDMLPGQVPATIVGHTTAAEINQIAGYLDELIREHHLPPKVMVVHQFQEQMIRDRPDLDPPDTVQLTLQMDGHGPPWLKTGNFARLADERFHDGFKLFYLRDFPLLQPNDVLALEPDVELVTYQ